MNKKLLLLLSTVTLTACGSVAIMDKSAAISAQPELPIKTNGELFGLGSTGEFTIGGLYKGTYSRDSSESSWFGTVSFKKGEMGVEIERLDNNRVWQLVCSGGGTSVNVGGISFGGNSPYKCSIATDNKQVGNYTISPQAGMIDFGIEKKEAGSITVNNDTYTVETIHTSDSLMMAIEHPLGYSFKHYTTEVAALQTNGIMTLQMLPELTEDQKDILIIGSVASALSWRPEE